MNICNSALVFALLVLPIFGLQAVETPTVNVHRPGTVLGWGDNRFNQITIPHALEAKALAAGIHYTVALKTNGTVVAWGVNNYGQTNVPPGLNEVSAISASGAHTIALRNDGTVVAWGDNRYGQASVPAGLNQVVAVSAGAAHSLALKSDGTVVAWGGNGSANFGQTSVPVGLNGVKAISAGYSHSVIVKNDGTVVSWGNNSYGQGSVPTGLSGIRSVSAGVYHTLALTSAGRVIAWGTNNFGQTLVPAGLADVIAIAAGSAHSVALKADGSVVGWGGEGAANYGQAAIPSDLHAVTSIAAGATHSAVLIRGPVAENNHLSIETRTVGVSNGTILITPSSLGNLYFEKGTEITLTANTPSSGRFLKWTGDIISKDNPVRFRISNNVAVTAHFAPVIDPLLRTHEFTWFHPDSGRFANWIVTNFTHRGGARFMTALPIAPGWNFNIQTIFSRDLNPQIGFNGIIWQSSVGQLGVWNFDTSGNLLTPFLMSTPAVGSEWHLIGGGLFNGDFHPDFLWQHNSGLLAVWYMGANYTFNPNGAFVLSGLPATGPLWKVVAVSDFDNDDNEDFLWQSTNGALAIWSMNGLNLSKKSSAMKLLNTPSLGGYWKVVVSTDADEDGNRDIVFQGNQGEIAIWYMTSDLTIRNTSMVLDSAPLGWELKAISHYPPR